MKDLLKTQNIKTVNYTTLKAGDVTPDGMIFVCQYTDDISLREKALLRTPFTRMSHYDAEAKEEAEQYLLRRLPRLRELHMISHAMTNEEIADLALNDPEKDKRLCGAFAWSVMRPTIDLAYGMFLETGAEYTRSREDLALVCLVRSINI